MEFGGFIYFILFLIFMILGIFNDLKKKKAQSMQEKKPNPESTPMFERQVRSSTPLPPPEVSYMPPPVVPQTQIPSEVRGFQSSLDQVSNFENYSSLEGSIYMDEKEEAFSFNYNNQKASTLAIEDTEIKAPVMHPLLKELHSKEGLDALRKGIIYGEIMQRKY